MVRKVRVLGSAPGGGLAGRFRIIGGQWRGRRLPVPLDGDVRPTPDRVRETLFNWLAPVIEGARCLDLYAGSGALGLEALSRGAARAVFVDRSGAALRQIAASLQLLQTDRGETTCRDALSYLEGRAAQFDVVFLDPPYNRGLLGPVAARLVERGWLAAGASIYLEHEADAAPPALPAGWRLFRSAAAGRVRYHLARPCLPVEGEP
jgi:16S rRNA (guanine966-N2)-methyltransferase